MHEQAVHAENLKTRLNESTHSKKMRLQKRCNVERMRDVIYKNMSVMHEAVGSGTAEVLEYQILGRDGRQVRFFRKMSTAATESSTQCQQPIPTALCIICNGTVPAQRDSQASIFES
jgi:hypothetical protein